MLILLQTLLATNEFSLGRIKGPDTPFNPVSGTGVTDPAQQISDLISTLVGFLTLVAGLGFLLYFLFGGLSWLTAGGERDRVEKAKNQMTNAVIGLIIVIAAITITAIVGQVLGLDILFINQSPENTINNLSP